MIPNEPWQKPPDPLRGLDTGSWTHYSIVNRLPETGRRALAENDFPAQVAGNIKRLISEIPNGKLMPIHDPAGPDIKAWRHYLGAHLGSNWLEAPWFLIETYFYRQLIATTGYFEGGPEKWRDPFAFQKQTTLSKLITDFNPPTEIEPLANQWLAVLWGNQADLSLWPQAGKQADRTAPTPAQERVLVDHRPQLDQYLKGKADQIRQFDLILDNSGQELLTDLVLVHQLRSQFPGATVHLHAKAHPTFVSDATLEDIQDSLNALLQDGTPAGQSLARQIRNGLEQKSILIHTHHFWNSPLAAWQMPNDLRNDLAQSNLLIFKGDANYRRLLGDRHWPFTAPYSQVLNYLPAPTISIRTLKSEIAIGLEPPKVEQAQQSDKDWMINGNWGLIQFSSFDS